jgi:hypothetical protein
VGSYQRLRVAEVTDQLTLLVARAAGFSEESEEFHAIRILVRNWRERNYNPHMDPDPKTGKARKSQLEFLIDFDLPWAIRRVRFCLGKLNGTGLPGCTSCEDWRGSKRRSGAAMAGKTRLTRKSFLAALREMRKRLNVAFLILSGGQRRLWSRDYEANPFRSSIAALELTSSDLRELLQLSDSERSEKATQLLGEKLTRQSDQTRSDAIDALTDQVRKEFASLFKASGGKCSDAMRPPEEADAGTLPRWNLFLRETLFYYYKHFDDFDQISYQFFTRLMWVRRPISSTSFALAKGRDRLDR